VPRLAHYVRLSGAIQRALRHEARPQGMPGIRRAVQACRPSCALDDKRDRLRGKRVLDRAIPTNSPEQRPAAMWEEHTDRIRALIAGALDVLADDLALDAGWMDNRRYRQAAAVHVLRAAGIYGASLAPTGETTAGEVGVTMALSEMLNRL